MISRDYLASQFEAFATSKNEEIVAAFSQVKVALGGNHDLNSTQELIPGDPFYDYVLGNVPERFEPIVFSLKSAVRARVVIVTSAGLTNGSTRYRSLNLGEMLTQHGVESCVIHAETEPAIFASRLSGVSCVIFQRCFSGQGNVHEFLNISRKAGIRCIFEIDDIVFPEHVSVIGSVAGGEWNREQATQISSVYEEFLKQTDGCIVSTQFLADYVSATYKLPTVVVRNRISTRYLRPRQPVTNRNIRIGYASGTRSHKKDFQTIEPVVFDIVSNMQNVELHVLGAADVGERLMSRPNVYSSPVLPYDEMMKVISTFDLLLVPLEDTAFNHAKSCIKFVECGAVGVPIIASTVTEYAAVIESGLNGWLADAPADWVNILRQIVRDPSLLTAAGRNAFETVKQHHHTHAEIVASDLLRLLGVGKV